MTGCAPLRYGDSICLRDTSKASGFVVFDQSCLEWNSADVFVGGSHQPFPNIHSAVFEIQPELKHVAADLLAEAKKKELSKYGLQVSQKQTITQSTEELQKVKGIDCNNIEYLSPLL
eukprot:m.39353 g.39353  ORF g.39353 m.39353 type:complete len:117 (+) comp10283_c0_seq11:136-486(+)